MELRLTDVVCMYYFVHEYCCRHSLSYSISPPSLSFLPLYLCFTVEAIEQAEAFLKQVMGEMEKRPNEEIICIPGNSVVVLLK